MKFVIERGSYQGSGIEPQPCTEAFEGVVEHEAFEAAFKHDAYSEPAWFIELDTLDDLLAFQQRDGHNLILDRMGNSPRLVIYDDYLE